MKVSLSWAAVLQKISDRAQNIDVAGVWPQKNIHDLAQCGALRWSISKKFGGVGLPPIQLHRRYEQLASACLSTALILTQRDAALEFLICAPAGPARKNADALLSKLAFNRIFASIGIAQLTTSGQHQNHGVTAVPDSRGWRISGLIPWATGANHCHYLVAGAKTPQGDQLLFALKMRQSGVKILPAPPMAVLNSSHTSPVQLNGVLIKADDVLSGPCPDALAVRNTYRRFSLNTCVLPLGVAAGAIELAMTLGKSRSIGCTRAIKELSDQRHDLAQKVYTMGGDKVEADSIARPAMLRAQCNDICFRCAAACLELAKGRGLMLEHPAQRRLREAMFFFVWSSGPAVIEETLHRLAHNK